MRVGLSHPKDGLSTAGQFPWSARGRSDLFDEDEQAQGFTAAATQLYRTSFSGPKSADLHGPVLAMSDGWHSSCPQCQISHQCPSMPVTLERGDTQTWLFLRK